MTEIHLSAADEVIRRLNELPNSYIFRGQASADWQLESSLERSIGAKWTPANARKFEDHTLDRFRPKFHLYDGENEEPTSRLEWLALMQHYGAPTRLLDFTESPFVALYFALETIDPKTLASRPYARMAIFALDYSKMMDASLGFIRSKDPSFKETRHTFQSKQDEIFDTIVDRQSYPIAWVTEPRRINKRLDRQSGCFLVAGDRSSRIQEILQDPMHRNIDLTKFTILSASSKISMRCFGR